MKKCLLSFAACISLLTMGCGNSASENTAEAVAQKQQTNALLAESKKNASEIEKLNEQYHEVPDERMLNNGGQNSPVYKELQQRYKTQLGAMKQSVEATGAKFVVVIITPEVGKNISALTRYGHPFIKQACTDLGVDVYDLSPVIAAQDARVITQVPRDGHWSKKGAEFLANQLDPILVKYAGHKSTKTYADAERPETFGDLAPSYEEILDGGKDMPYKVTSNAQGLRMDHDIKFPKAKQHILFLGGSQFFSPFLDNEFIATTLLQKKHPEMEIMNAAMIAGCTDDFLSQWEEKAKYSEPDVVIVQTNGTDITDLFFTNRNHMARTKKPYYPSPVEEKYFLETYRK
ncbi:MAG: hypothetical protein KF744_11060 [Taibaiella sp.]|nr:hypothetical protein [Taibaiella sp.]